MTDFKNRKEGHGACKSMTVKYLPSLGKVAHFFIPKLKKRAESRRRELDFSRFP